MYIPIKGVFVLAYDLHIFKGENWWSGTDRPITAEELLRPLADALGALIQGDEGEFY